MSLNRRSFIAGAAAGAGVLAMPSIVQAQTKKLKLSHYLPPKHQINAEMIRWADELREKSAGALDVEVFPAGQMGPPPRQYDLTRTGVADISFIYTAMSPGRFPVTDLLALPFVLADDNGNPLSTASASWLSTSLKDRVAQEYVGVELLYSVTTTSTGFFMRDVLVKTPDDLKGLRVRPTSGAVANQLTALGASPATVPPTELADAIEKGVVDGAIFNFEGGRAFQLHQAVRKVTMLANSTATFSLIVNADVMNSLPSELSALIRETTGPAAGRRVGGLYDAAEASGRAFMEEKGVEVVELRGDDTTAFRERLAPVYDAQLAALKETNPDGDAIVADIKRLMAEA